MTSTVLSTDTPFVRTRATWLGYAMTVFFGFTISLPGPLMPFVRDALDLTYTQMGYHFMLQAAGGLITSLTGDRIASRIGNAGAGGLGLVLIVTSLPGLVFGSGLPMTLVAVTLYGIGAGLTIFIATAIITDANPRHTTRSFTESNIAGGSAVIVGPIMVGLTAKSALGWQAIALFPLINLAALLTIFRGLPIPPERRKRKREPADDTASSPLPLLFWMFGMLAFLTVALEWLISSWSADFLATVVGYSTSTAAALVSVFTGAVVIGRVIGRRLMTFVSESRLLFFSLVWVLLVFPLYWVGSPPALSVVGLFVIGLGVGNLSPLCMSGAMTAASPQTNRASARFGLFPSLGNLTMLQLLGILADQFGIQRAYGVVMVVVILAMLMTLQINRMRRTAVSA
jgi:fucose permease